MDPMAGRPYLCDNCGKITERGNPVIWCPAWRAWLCGYCQFDRTDAELKILAGPPPQHKRRDLPVETGVLLLWMSIRGWRTGSCSPGPPGTWG
jgi:hypothetical protein